MTLNAEQQKLIHQMVELGFFDSPDKAIDMAIRLLDEHNQKLAALREEIQKGLDSGPSIPGEQVFAELRENLAKKLHQE